MNIHMAKKGQKGYTKVVYKGTFISKQSLIDLSKFPLVIVLTNFIGSKTIVQIHLYKSDFLHFLGILL